MIKLKDLMLEFIKTGKTWFVYEGTQNISVIFESGTKISFELGPLGRTKMEKDKYRSRAANQWSSIAREIYNNPELNEVGDPIQKSWENCFEEALNDDRMKSFIKSNDKTPIF